MAQHKINNINIEIERHQPTGGDKKDIPLLLISGLGSQLIVWPQSLIKSITDCGYEVIVFDNRDAGLSDKFREFTPEMVGQSLQQLKSGETDVDVAYTLYDMAEDVKAIIDCLKLDKVHLLGCSMGGMIAQLFAQKYNDYLASLCIVFSTTGDPDLPEMNQETREKLQSPTISDSAETVIDSWAKSGVYFGSPKLGVDYDTCYEKSKKLYARNYSPDGTIRQYLAIMATQWETAKNKNITVPTLAICGDSDVIFSPEHSHRVAETVLNGKAVVLKDWGHDFPESICPELAKNILENIERN
ncbi:MAG: alpha/beta fold hydrolase [Alphaproteobacteria bacterium]